MGLDIQVAIIGLAGAIVGGAISSLTALGIARMERKKYARERLWELRREGYTQILASLIPASNIAKHISDEYERNPHGYDASDRMRAAMEQFDENLRASRAAFHSYRLVVSASFADDFIKMEWGLREIAENPNLIPPEAAELMASLLKSTMVATLSQALNELEIPALSDSLKLA